MRTIRQCVFETNSSSCHSITICGEAKLEEYKKGLVACIHKFRFDSDEDYCKTIVPDNAFWTIPEMVSHIKENLDKVEISEGYQEELNYISKNLSEDGILNVLTDPYGETDDVEHYEIIYVMEKFFDGKSIYYGTYGDQNPFNSLEDKTESYDGIEGPITSVESEINC